jgi:hypothetical protein
MRGRRGNGGGGGHHHGNSGGGGGNHGQRRVNPRVQTFDSNGPEVRIRGNAFQICEKYLTLARDAQAAGDRILAESYLQHHEHYQRFINEMNEEFARQNPHAAQQPYEGGQPQPSVSEEGAPQPSSEGLADLDQGFLVGRPGAPQPTEGQPQQQQQASGDRQPQQQRQRHYSRQQPQQPESEAEAV